MRIRIFYDKTNFRLGGWRKAGKVIERVIRKEGKIPGDPNFILTDRESVRKMNVQFLCHDFFTDVLTFNNNNGNLVNGEIYVSEETVRLSAINYNVSLNDEVLRVMIHGVLHLVGYDDKTGKERKKMHEMEDFWVGVIKE